MDGWTLFFVLLPLTLCFDSEVTFVKNLGNKPDVTRICDNKTSTLTLIVCRIRTKRSREECRLLYQREQGFENKCDSRFSLIKPNQTVFLYVTSLTPEDSGKYSCECSDADGTYITHLNVTVEDVLEGADPSSRILVLPPLIGVTIFIVMAAVILGFLHRNLSHGRRLEALSEPNGEPQNIEPYSTFIRRESGLYSIVTVQNSNINNNSNKFTK